MRELLWCRGVRSTIGQVGAVHAVEIDRQLHAQECLFRIQRKIHVATSASIMAISLALGSMAAVGASPTAYADSKADMGKEAAQALQTLYKNNPAALALSEKARAVLVFPRITKAGFVFGAGYGEGELRRGSQTVNYYNSLTGPWGLQAGAQSYGYVVFLMTPKAKEYLNDSKGWEIGVGPTVVVVSEGIARNLSTTTLKDDAYAFIFDQQGLMAGVSIQGTKISKIKIK